MTLAVVFHQLAEAELNEAATFYAQARPGLGETFIEEVERIVVAIAEAPLAGRPGEDDVRSRLIRRFPYRVHYRTEIDHVRILAIGHQKRRPFYWRGRS